MKRNNKEKISEQTSAASRSMTKLSVKKVMAAVTVNAVLCAAALFAPVEMSGIAADILRFLLPLPGIIILAVSKEMKSASLLLWILIGGAAGYFSETIGFAEFLLFIPIMIAVLTIVIIGTANRKNWGLIFAPLLLVYLILTGIMNWQAEGRWIVGESYTPEGYHIVNYACSAGAMDKTHYKTTKYLELIDSPVFKFRFIINEKDTPFG